MSAIHANCDGVHWVSPSPAHLGLVRSPSEFDSEMGLESNQGSQGSRQGATEFFDFADGIMAQGAAYFGRPLFDAVTEEHLSQLLDGLSGDREFLKFHEYICTTAIRHWRPVTPYRLLRRISILTGKRSDDAHVERLASLIQISEAATTVLLQGGLPEPAIPPMSLVQLLEHIATPAEYIAPMRGAIRSAASQIGLLWGHLVRHRRGNNTLAGGWQEKSLLEFAIDGQQRHLRLLAGMPGTRVPEGVVPLNERVPWGPLVEKWNKLLLEFQAIRMDAARSGASVYFPFDEPPDEP